jgi:Papain-like cysteine protease AvrRpt2
MPSVQINGVVHQRQLNPRACWYTCLQMVVKYVENGSQSSHADLKSPEYFPNMQKRYTDGSNPSWAEWREWAKQCGFKPLDLTPNQDGIYQFLSRYGPIIYSGTWGNSFDGHVVVLTGIDTDSGMLSVDDPLEVNAPVQRNMNTFFGQLTQTLWENPLFVY